MSQRSQISFMPSATGISNLMLNFWPEMLTSGVTSQPAPKRGSKVRPIPLDVTRLQQIKHIFYSVWLHLLDSFGELVSHEPPLYSYNRKLWYPWTCTSTAYSPSTSVSWVCETISEKMMLTHMGEKKIRAQWERKDPQRHPLPLHNVLTSWDNYPGAGCLSAKAWSQKWYRFKNMHRPIVIAFSLNSKGSL